MTTLRSAMLLVTTLPLAGASALAQSNPLIGMWARDQDECRPEPLYVFRRASMAGLNFTCDVANYRRDGENWAVEARQCKAMEGADPNIVKPETTFRTVLAAGRLTVFFPDGRQTLPLEKCKAQ